MSQRIILNQNPKPQTAAHVVPSPSAGAKALTASTSGSSGQIAQTWPFNYVVAASPVVTLPAPVYFGQVSPLVKLAAFLAIGRTYHPLCRQAFVEKVQLGHYAYERRDEWRTCALAAAYAGAFGPQAIERPEFSYSQAIWQLNRQVGYNLDQLWVVGPTGRTATVYDEMVLLTDANYWTRRGVAEWLPTATIIQQGKVAQ